MHFCRVGVDSASVRETSSVQATDPSADMAALPRGRVDLGHTGLQCHSAVHCAAPHCTALYSTALHCTIQHCGALHSLKGDQTL